MTRPRRLSALIIAAALLQTAFASGPSKPGPSTEDSAWQNELEAWRAQRAANLQAPEGWLSLIGLDWLQDGDNSFGSASDNRLQITAKIPAEYLSGAGYEKPRPFAKRIAPFEILISRRSPAHSYTS